MSHMEEIETSSKAGKHRMKQTKTHTPSHSNDSGIDWRIQQHLQEIKYAL